MVSTTTFVIAHHPSTITNADCILVIYDGKIVQEGNHQKLVKQKGYYHDLYLGQFVEKSIHINATINMYKNDHIKMYKIKST